jgi:hypothetical protein
MTRKEDLMITLASHQFYLSKSHPIRDVFDTNDLDQARSLRVLKEADASGSFGPNGFRCRQLDPSRYAVDFFPGGAQELPR